LGRSFTYASRAVVDGAEEDKMEPFSDPSNADKYRKLGFSVDALSMRLSIGHVSICAVEHPIKGVLLIFESIRPRSVCQYETSLPERCSVEQIAGLIYVNIAQNFRDGAEMYKAHFQSLGLSLFQ
jgi:hypothetical protein